MIEQDPTFDYRTYLGISQHQLEHGSAQLQDRGCHVKHKPIGFRTIVKAMPSMAKSPDDRWVTDMCHVWTGRDGWASLATLIDCYTRELLG